MAMLIEFLKRSFKSRFYLPLVRGFGMSSDDEERLDNPNRL